LTAPLVLTRSAQDFGAGAGAGPSSASTDSDTGFGRVASSVVLGWVSCVLVSLFASTTEGVCAL
jgi:hypothetical protein